MFLGILFAYLSFPRHAWRGGSWAVTMGRTNTKSFTGELIARREWISHACRARRGWVCGMKCEMWSAGSG